MKCQLIAEDLHTGNERLEQEEKGGTEYEMVGWHHRRYGHDFEHTPGDNEGQGCLVSCSVWGCKEQVGHNLVTEQQQQKYITI